jgi:hypothetical protein
MQSTDRRIEGNFSQGWPVALFITALVAGAFFTAGMIHKQTFHSPRDVTGEYRKEKTGVGASEATGERKTGH